VLTEDQARRLRASIKVVRKVALGEGAEAEEPWLVRTLPSFDRKPLIYLQRVASVCLRSGRDAEQIEGAVLCAGGGGEDGGEAVAAEADDIAGAAPGCPVPPMLLRYGNRRRGVRLRPAIKDLLLRLTKPFVVLARITWH
jgi:hypothetical protein